MTDRPLPPILARIAETKRAEIDALLSAADEKTLLARARERLAVDPPRDFLGAVSRSPRRDEIPINLIAEVKKASPSKGVIREDFDPPAVAAAYEAGGASAISCLTDATYFQGSLEYLGAVREATALPVLRKDFILHRSQVCEARIAGADAVLLIARMLSERELAELIALTLDLGMTPLCEAHDDADLDTLLPCDPPLVGVNNRDLDTFVVDTETTFRLRERIPDDVPVVGESGVFHPEDMTRLAEAGVQAALVGESLMRQDDIAAAVRRLLGRA